MSTRSDQVTAAANTQMFFSPSGFTGPRHRNFKKGKITSVLIPLELVRVDAAHEVLECHYAKQCLMSGAQGSTASEAQDSNAVVQGIFTTASMDALVLFDPGATHSFFSPSFSIKMGKQPTYLQNPLSVATTMGESMDTDIVYPSCPMNVQGRELFADLVLLEVLAFDVILGMDWLAQHYANVDCTNKLVIFNTPGIE
ncbi:uncharacterized protein LOC126681825 [Mercurialis annua]|uniref:uncharacterized protein LOC126681825 n=1 Tax=Mercurialis annua TaxID=3986 RepID=UPI00215DEA92|nr:uncharacterized protein LOC126681825 [Mercurialis annua]